MRYFLPLLVIGVVTVLLVVPRSWLESLASGAEGRRESLTFAILSTTYAVLVLLPVLSTGVLYACLRAVRGDTPRVRDLFVSFNEHRMYLASILFPLPVMVLAGLAPALVFLLGGVVGVRLAFVPFLVSDEGLHLVAAVRESWRRTSGYFWTVLGTILYPSVIGVVGFFLLLAGLGGAVMFFGAVLAQVSGGVVGTYELLAWLTLNGTIVVVPLALWPGLALATLFVAVKARG
ncbi:MAG: hypothetical protein HY689_06935 [Chloroflexi bacterium]|nr:hypothetical protein [Chloroflexota bacterium]